VASLPVSWPNAAQGGEQRHRRTAEKHDELASPHLDGTTRTGRIGSGYPITSSVSRHSALMLASLTTRPHLRARAP